MPISFTIDRVGGVVRSTAYGVLTCIDALDHLNRLGLNPDFSPNFSHLWDYTNVTKFAVTSSEIELLADNRVFSAESHCALVAPSDLAYGLARELQSQLDMAGANEVRVFRKMDEALTWLGVQKRRGAGELPSSQKAAI